MHLLYLVSVFLHLLAVSAWLGSMFFLVVVAVPWMRRGNAALGGRFLRETWPSRRAMGWVAFVVLTLTGSFNLYVRGVRFSSFGDPLWLGSDFGRAVVLKLVIFVVVVLASAVHDFRIGPMASEAMASSDPVASERLRKTASRMGRANFLLALVLVALGVTLVRGCPG